MIQSKRWFFITPRENLMYFYKEQKLDFKNIFKKQSFHL